MLVSTTRSAPELLAVHPVQTRAPVLQARPEHAAAAAAAELVVEDQVVRCTDASAMAVPAVETRAAAANQRTDAAVVASSLRAARDLAKGWSERQAGFAGEWSADPPTGCRLSSPSSTTLRWILYVSAEIYAQ